MFQFQGRCSAGAPELTWQRVTSCAHASACGSFQCARAGLYGPGRSALNAIDRMLQRTETSSQVRRGEQRYTNRVHVSDVSEVCNALHVVMWSLPQAIQGINQGTEALAKHRSATRHDCHRFCTCRGSVTDSVKHRHKPLSSKGWHCCRCCACQCSVQRPEKFSMSRTKSQQAGVKFCSLQQSCAASNCQQAAPVRQFLTMTPRGKRQFRTVRGQ